MLLEPGHRLQALGAGQRPLHAVRLQARLGGDAFEHLGPADVEAFLEVAVEQALHDAVLTPLPVGFPDQAMGQPRVGRALHAVEGEVDPELAAGARHLHVELRAARLAELARAVDLALHALGAACRD